MALRLSGFELRLRLRLTLRLRLRRTLTLTLRLTLRRTLTQADVDVEEADVEAEAGAEADLSSQVSRPSCRSACWLSLASTRSPSSPSRLAFTQFWPRIGLRNRPLMSKPAKIRRNTHPTRRGWFPSASPRKSGPLKQKLRRWTHAASSRGQEESQVFFSLFFFQAHLTRQISVMLESARVRSARRQSPTSTAGGKTSNYYSYLLVLLY